MNVEHDAIAQLETSFNTFADGLKKTIPDEESRTQALEAIEEIKKLALHMVTHTVVLVHRGRRIQWTKPALVRQNGLAMVKKPTLDAAALRLEHLRIQATLSEESRANQSSKACKALARFLLRLGLPESMYSVRAASVLLAEINAENRVLRAKWLEELVEAREMKRRPSQHLRSKRHASKALQRAGELFRARCVMRDRIEQERRETAA